MTDPKPDSTLPPWMRAESSPARTTLHWRVTQWLDRRSWWGGVRRGLRDRPRVSKRFPKTYAVLAWVIPLLIVGYLGYRVIEYYFMIKANQV